MVEVKIIGQVITAQYGTLSTGDILKTSPEFAKHLVDDCGAAKYVKAKKEVVPKLVKAAKVAKIKAESAPPDISADVSKKVEEGGGA